MMDWLVFIKEMIAPGMQIGVVVGVFLILTNQLKGLKQQLSILNDTIEAQKKTLDAMERRNIETEKIAEVYKNFIKEVPEALDKYKEIIQKTKDATIKELEEANAQQNEALKVYKQEKLEEIKARETLINDENEISKALQQKYEQQIMLLEAKHTQLIDVIDKIVSETVSQQYKVKAQNGGVVIGDKYIGKDIIQTAVSRDIIVGRDYLELEDKQITVNKPFSEYERKLHVLKRKLRDTIPGTVEEQELLEQMERLEEKLKERGE